MTLQTRNRLPSVFSHDALFGPLLNEFFEKDHWSPKVYASQNRSIPFDLHKIEGEDGNPLALEFKFALAGYSKEDVNVEFDDGVLTISAEKVEEEESNKIELYRGISKKSIKQSYQLTDSDLDVSQIKAEMKDGQLTLIIPYLEKKQTRKLIDIL